MFSAVTGYGFTFQAHTLEGWLVSLEPEYTVAQAVNMVDVWSAFGQHEDVTCWISIVTCRWSTCAYQT
jgi:hypothetical protein